MMIVAMALVFVPALYVFVMNPEIKTATLLAGAGLLIAFLSRFNDIIELSGFGVSAKLKDTIKEAHATIEQVKDLAMVLAKSSLSNTARSGWWGGLTDDQSQEFFKETVDVLKAVGLSENQIFEAGRDFQNCILRSYYMSLLGQTTIPDTDNSELRKEWELLRKCPVETPHKVDVLKAFFIKYDLMTKDVQKRLDDYEYYFTHHEFKDFADYKNRDNWPERLIDPLKTRL